MDKNLSKSALKRLRRKQAHDIEGGEEGEQEEEEEEEEMVAHFSAPVHQRIPATIAEETVEREEAEPVALAPVSAPTIPVIPAVAPISVHAASFHVVDAPTAPHVNRVGVIGKAVKTVDVPMHVEVEHHAPPAFTLNSADQHHNHQQHLINLLLGDSSTPDAGLFTSPAPIHQAYNSQYLPHSYSSQSPSALYASSSQPAPIGSSRQTPGLSVQTAAPTGGRHTPPPPGLSPIGAGVTTSRFTFGDFNSSAPPLNVPVPPPLQYQYQPPLLQTYAPTGSNYTPSAVPALPLPTPPAHTAPAGNSYYKSKSGFSVRL